MIDRYIREDSKYEAAVHHLDAPGNGPTAVVVGGQHGNEPSGFKTASRIAAGSVERGEVWVIPRLNKTGIEAGTRHAHPGGTDLNRTWNAGGDISPRITKQAWAVIEEADPDVVLDLHSSRGIYKRPSGYGQAIFPSSEAAKSASATCRWLTTQHIAPSRYDTQDYEFLVGNVQGTKGKGLLSHKVGYETDAAMYLIEATRQGVPLDQRIEWLYAAATRCLEREGVVIE